MKLLSLCYMEQKCGPSMAHLFVIKNTFQVCSQEISWLGLYSPYSSSRGWFLWFSMQRKCPKLSVPSVTVYICTLNPPNRTAICQVLPGRGGRVCYTFLFLLLTVIFSLTASTLFYLNLLLFIVVIYFSLF